MHEPVGSCPATTHSLCYSSGRNLKLLSPCKCSFCNCTHTESGQKWMCAESFKRTQWIGKKLWSQITVNHTPPPKKRNWWSIRTRRMALWGVKHILRSLALDEGQNLASGWLAVCRQTLQTRPQVSDSWSKSMHGVCHGIHSRQVDAHVSRIWKKLSMP